MGVVWWFPTLSYLATWVTHKNINVVSITTCSAPNSRDFPQNTHRSMCLRTTHCLIPNAGKTIDNTTYSCFYVFCNLKIYFYSANSGHLSSKTDFNSNKTKYRKNFLSLSLHNAFTSLFFCFRQSIFYKLIFAQHIESPTVF